MLGVEGRVVVDDRQSHCDSPVGLRFGRRVGESARLPGLSNPRREICSILFRAVRTTFAHPVWLARPREKSRRREGKIGLTTETQRTQRRQKTEEEFSFFFRLLPS